MRLHNKLLRDAVKKRKIEYVLHFTRLENLNLILSYGIIPRRVLEEVNIDSITYNDLYRLDKQKRASCFSISHPNYKIFYRLRRRNRKQKWIVIVCKPNVLWLKNCAFCYENAASKNVTNIPILNRKGVVAFEELFSLVYGKPSRDEIKLPDYYPTNPQAEVLIFDIVEPKYIIGVVCENSYMEQKLKVEYPNFDFLYDRDFFSPRLDYEYWR